MGKADLQSFDPESFVEARIEDLKEAIGDEQALVAVSGGVDSTTCAVLTHKAIGDNLVCVILDDAFMRTGEPEYVAEVLSKPPLSVPLKVVDVRERFLNAMKGVSDAEEKRKRFQETFYQVLGETARREGCEVLVQGTIRADIEETLGGVKTQHNVLEQMGIDPKERFGFKVAEPLVNLYKDQVRIVARLLGLPEEFSERQPFPGPGLSVRVVGEIRPDKLDTVKKATTIVERRLAEHAPSQYFASVIDNKGTVQNDRIIRVQDSVAQLLDVPPRNVHVKIFMDKATGVREGERRYGNIVGLKVQTVNGKTLLPSVSDLISVQRRVIGEDSGVVRVFYTIRDLNKRRPYIIGIRAVQTENFLTAEVSQIPWITLDRAAEEVMLECPNVSTVYYDVTPKPPATIEME
ncbi:GMP synthase [Candidatus Bathyarchaeota archaeon]|nr:GMP synthase [Candidatus Bathyarchaeota archaeon]